MAVSSRLLPAKNITDVGAGNNKTVAVPASGEQWRLLAVLAEFTTTATIGARRLLVEVRDGSNAVFHRQSAGADQAASLSQFYNFAPGLPAETAFTNLTINRPLPPELLLAPAWNISVRDLNAVDATDTLRVRVLVEIQGEKTVYTV